MERYRSVPRLIATVVVALVPGFVLAQQTTSVQNSTTVVAECGTYETEPQQTALVLKSINPNQSIDTGLPANGNTLVSLQLRQNNENVGGTPFLMTNVLRATLTNTCYAGVPPCVDLTPASSVDKKDLREANAFLAERSATKEYCLTGKVRATDKGKFMTLGNGLVVQLIGNLAVTPDSGNACLCGVRATPPTPDAPTIFLEVKQRCEEAAPAAPKPKE